MTSYQKDLDAAVAYLKLALESYLTPQGQFWTPEGIAGLARCAAHWARLSGVGVK
jgi:hypothetical protein